MRNIPGIQKPVIELTPGLLPAHFTVNTNWQVITGAPCSGKTTIIDLLTGRGYQTIPEPGRMYVEKEIARGRTLDDIRRDPAVFNKELMNLSLVIEGGLSPDQLLFLDRAYPDCLAYAQLIGLDPNKILQDCFHHRYAGIFILDRFPTQKDIARIEDDKTAEFLDRWIARDYQVLGYEVIRVPVLPPSERVEYILARLTA